MQSNETQDRYIDRYVLIDHCVASNIIDVAFDMVSVGVGHADPPSSSSSSWSSEAKEAEATFLRTSVIPESAFVAS